MDLVTTTDERGGVTLVTCRLDNPAALARRVRIENELDGPVLPPRRHGVALSGWDAGGVSLRVEPEATAAVGYAVAAPAAEPPARIAAEEPIRKGAVDADRPAGGSEPTAAGAVRTLGAYRPPRAAVTASERDAAGSTARRTPSADANARVDDGGGTGEASPAGPAAVDAWLDAVERRVERAETLDGADVPTATEAVAAAGGLDAVRELDGRVETDAERLRAVASRATALAERAAAADVPTGPLARLA